jgi:hypothetical protein
MKQRYYGTFKIGDKTYRTTESYETQELAKQWATSIANDFITKARATGDASIYTEDYLNGISNSISAMNAMEALAGDTTDVLPNITTATGTALDPNQLLANTDGTVTGTDNDQYYGLF